MRFEVLAAVVMKNEFWDTVQCCGEQLLALSRSNAVDMVLTPQKNYLKLLYLGYRTIKAQCFICLHSDRSSERPVMFILLSKCHQV